MGFGGWRWLRLGAWEEWGGPECASPTTPSSPPNQLPHPAAHTHPIPPHLCQVGACLLKLLVQHLQGGRAGGGRLVARGLLLM